MHNIFYYFYYFSLHFLALLLRGLCFPLPFSFSIRGQQTEYEIIGKDKETTRYLATIEDFS